MGVVGELSVRPPGIENPTTVDVGKAFFPVDVASSFFNSEAQDFFTVGTAGAEGAGGVTSTSVASVVSVVSVASVASVASSCGGLATVGISAGTVVEGVEGDFASEGDVLDIEV